MAASVQYQILLNRLRYKHLVMLVTLGNNLNMHRASEALNMSQPAATKMLKEIEAAFGCALFERLNRGMRPTAIGEEVLEFARQSLSALERCAEDVASFREGGYGHLSIGTVMGAAPGLVAESIAEIKRHKPMLNIRIMGDTSDQLLELLQQGKIDMAIGRRASFGARIPCTFEPLSNEKLIAVTRAGHPFESQPPASMTELVNRWPWILQTRTSPARQAVESHFRELNLPSPADITECGSVFAMLQLVQLTDAVMVLSESVLKDYLEMGLLRPVPLHFAAHLEPFGILLREGDTLRREQQDFIELLRERAQGRSIS